MCLVEPSPRGCLLGPKSAVIFFFSALRGLTSYTSCIQTLLHIGAVWGPLEAPDALTVPQTN